MTAARRRLAVAVLPVALVLTTVGAADAQRSGRGGMPMRSPSSAGDDLPPEVAGAFAPSRAVLSHMEARGFFATGLMPVYPTEASCPVVTSPFAASTRGDGSLRARQFFAGRHGGVDIPAPDATPILAVADGTVVATTPGESIGGIGLVLQHAPADTGLPVWTYTEYKHLQEMPVLAVGQRVRGGAPIARVGRTGTQDGYYGALGHAHLHLTAFFAAGPGHRAGRVFVPDDGQWMDPLALFRPPPHESKALRALPEADRQVRLAYVTTTGTRVPADAKVVWPLACAPR